MSGSLCLLVLLGGVLVSGMPAMPRQFISDNLKQTHESITDVLSLTEPEVGGNPLFRSVVETINNSCQRKVDVMNATLDVYSRIFSSILTQHPGRTGTLLGSLSDAQRSWVKSVVKEFGHKMEDLKRRLRCASHDREDVLSKISRIQVDDPLVQRKALAQFTEVYQAASVIGSPRCSPAHSSSAE